MPDSWFKYLFLAGLIALEVVRFPHRMRNKRERQQKLLTETRTSGLDFLLDLVAFTGMEILPLLYIFTPWLNFADYAAPAWMGWLGVVVFGAALGLLWRAHADLGQSWSPTLEITPAHQLVTAGIYRLIRHPIYAAVWVSGLAQVLMLHNWIVGPATLLLFLPVYLVRVPREEGMMLDHFGDEYRAYMRRTGRILPRVG